MKHIKLFESWVETESGYDWTGNPSKNFTSSGNSLFFEKNGKKYEIKPGDWSSDWKVAEEDLKKLGRGWRIPTLEELEYIDNLLKEEGREWEFSDVIDFDGYFWSNEKAFDNPKNDSFLASMYVWDFNKHTYRYLDPRGRAATFLYIKEI